MAKLNRPKRAGFAFSHKSCSVQEDADEWGGITEITGTVKVDGREPVKDERMRRFGVTRGDLVIEGEIKFHLDAYKAWKQAHPQPLTEFFESVLWTFEEGAERTQLELIDFEINSIERSSSGTGPVEVTLAYTAGNAKEDGEAFIEESDGEEPS